MTGGQRGTVAVILLGHFTAAFAALGMPPFFALILQKSLHSEAAYLVGWFYVLPTLFTALSSPWWGALADRMGKKAMLVRAQLGLAASFLLAGFAESILVFFVALALQGLLGGTFGASNAYLATVLRGQALTRGLTLMQGSARAALVLAPLVLGLFMSMSSPIELYRYLALLPLLSALLIWLLPGETATDEAAARTQRKPVAPAALSALQIFVLQFAFVFATVITFPYFVPFGQQSVAGLSASMAGLLFGLPHLVYLLGAGLLSRWLGQRQLGLTLSLAFVLLGISLAAQALAFSLTALVGWRVLMGLGLTMAYLALHGLIAGLVHSGNAGKTFGWFESSSKWGGVLAGLAAGFAVQGLDLRAPFFIGAAVIAAAAFYLVVQTLVRPRCVVPD
ncbi:MFS transporter [Thermithiobacillus plumbiphilus]|uniref:MFS transporter n=1 Tax=Thermithiobacillus plumbiphilus TaxID=1729899 RepID=A0ABU9DB33_9PROT